MKIQSLFAEIGGGGVGAWVWGLRLFGGDGPLWPGLQHGAGDKNLVVAAILTLVDRPGKNLDFRRD